MRGGRRQFIVRATATTHRPDIDGQKCSCAKVVDTVMLLRSDYGWFWATIAEMTRDMLAAGCRMPELKWDAEPWGDWT